ncbi:hypothetical protein ACNKHV_07510 [Shigella flexneri]
MKPSIVPKLEALHERHEEVRRCWVTRKLSPTRNVFAHYPANMRS